jgi:hypothetical protein
MACPSFEHGKIEASNMKERGKKARTDSRMADVHVRRFVIYKLKAGTNG